MYDFIYHRKGNDLMHLIIVMSFVENPFLFIKSNPHLCWQKKYKSQRVKTRKSENGPLNELNISKAATKEINIA